MVAGRELRDGPTLVNGGRPIPKMESEKLNAKKFRNRKKANERGEKFKADEEDADVV